MADYDYGLRATAAGIELRVTDRFVGTCSRNSDIGTFRDPAADRRTRWRRLMGPKGLPPREWRHFQRQHGGRWWPLAFASPYLNVLIGPRPRPDGNEVTIVYRWLPHYRVRFYELAREELAQHGVRLRLVVDRPDPVTATKQDGGELAWAEELPNRRWRLSGHELVWQPVLGTVRTSDLVVVEQATKLLVNPALMVWRRLGGPRLALWGHGVNRDRPNASGVGERVKRLLIGQCDWWFAYTAAVAELVVAAGYPEDRVTDLQNATDTSALRRAAERARADGRGPTGRDLAFVGSLYEGKGLADLVRTADRVRESVPGLRLTVVGAGPDAAVLEVAAETRPWINLVGPLQGEELVEAVCMASAMVVPAAAGLVVLDAFAIGIPPVVAESDNHGPEVDYVVDGVNGVKVAGPASSQAFADALIQVLTDADLHLRLVDGGDATAAEVTVEEMARRFAHGVIEALL
jgi:glycosyltransferase involved in cell wall biosynthesis